MSSKAVLTSVATFVSAFAFGLYCIGNNHDLAQKANPSAPYSFTGPLIINALVSLVVALVVLYFASVAVNHADRRT